jgi:hypothetical protein
MRHCAYEGAVRLLERFSSEDKGSVRLYAHRLNSKTTKRQTRNQTDTFTLGRPISHFR